MVLLPFSLTVPGAQTVTEAAEILNPISPETTVTPKDPEPIPAPQPPEVEEPKKVKPKTAGTRGGKRGESVKKKKAKHFFAPDTTVSLEQSQKARILDGDSSETTNTGRVLSSMSGRLIFGGK